MAIRREWLWGDKRMGYAVQKLTRQRNPWRVEVWFDGRRWRTDDFATEAEATKFARERKRRFYGGKTQAQAIKNYRGK